MKKIILIISILLFAQQTFSQAPTIQWQKSIGGSGTEKGFSVQQTSDGGFIIAGEASSNDGDLTGIHSTNSGSEYWIIKIDGSGNIQWQKCYGGTSAETAYSVRATSDGGFIVAGSAISSDGDVTGHHGASINFDSWILKVDTGGNIQWKKCLGGTYSDLPNDIWVTADGGYIFAGYTQSNDGDVSGHHGPANLYHDFWVVRLDSTGAIQWQKCLGGTNIDYANCVQQTTDGGFVVGGPAQSLDGDVTGNHSLGSDPDYWLVKLSVAGTIQWQKCYGGLLDDSFTSIQQTSDGGYILAGSSESNNADVTGNHGSFDYWIVKTDASGNIQWQKSLGGSLSETARAVQQISDGGYIIAGYANSSDGDVTAHIGSADFWIVKLDNSGTLLWEKSLGGTLGDLAYAFRQTTDGGCIVIGHSFSNDGDVTGHHGSNTAHDMWVVKLSSVVGIEEEMSHSLLNIFPNPATSELRIENAELKIKEIEIYNAVGEKVFSQLQTSNLKLQTVDVSQLLPGIYFITVTDQAGNKVTKKVVKM